MTAMKRNAYRMKNQSDNVRNAMITARWMLKAAAQKQSAIKFYHNKYSTRFNRA